MARIQLAERSDLPEEKRHLIAAFREPEDLEPEYRHLMSSAERNVYAAFGRAPPLLAAFREFAGTLWDESGLDPRDRELVILRVARELDSAYIWHQHGRIALSAGLPADDVRAVGANALERFDDGEAALLAYVRAYLHGAVDDDLHDRIAAHYDDATIVGVGMLVGAYATIARSMDALDVPIEEEFIGWDLANV